MGACKICGEKASLFRQYHRACLVDQTNACKKISEYIGRALNEPVDLQKLRAYTDQLVQTHQISGEQYEQLVIVAIQKVIETALADRVLTLDEAVRIGELISAYDVEESSLGSFQQKLNRGRTLTLMEGQILPRSISDRLDPLNINFETSETPFANTNMVRLLLQKTKTVFRGRSQGFSLRLMKGVYYRVGSSQGEPIRTKFLQEEDKGILILTNRNLYFRGFKTTVKIPVRKILSAKAFADGFSVAREATNPKIYMFQYVKPDKEEMEFFINALLRANQLKYEFD